jgi:hypothetical protein
VQGAEKEQAEDTAKTAKGSGTALLQGVVAILAVVVLVQAVSMAFLVQRKRNTPAEVVNPIQIVREVQGKQTVSTVDAIFDRRNLSSSSRSNLLAEQLPEPDTPKSTLQVV